MTSKEVKELVRKLESQGFSCEQTRKNHIKVYKNHRLIATLPSTPLDRRSLKHVLQYLRQAGFEQ